MQLRLAVIVPKGTDDTLEQKRFRKLIVKQKERLEEINNREPKEMSHNPFDMRNAIRDFLEQNGIRRFGVTRHIPDKMYRNSHLPTNLDRLIVFVVPMKYEEMVDVPSQRSATEILRAYWQTGEIVVKLSEFLMENGYRVQGHHPLGDINDYHHILFPPHAVAAGLGEKGRTGLFIDHHYGPMVRIGAVSTDAPLEYDEEVDKGINAFCHRCRYCAKFCPPKAISNVKFTQILEEGNRIDFKINGERCIKYFEKHFACGKCLFKCVLTQPNVEEVQKRIRRIETWYDRWVKNGPPEEWKEAFAQVS